MNYKLTAATEILGAKYIRQQVLFSFLLCVLAGLLILVVPDFPYDRKMSAPAFAAGAMYLTFYVLFERLEKYYYSVILTMSVAAIVLLSFMVHMSGGIISPLVFFYFAILMSEATYGIGHSMAVLAAAISYTTVILGEALGYLDVSCETARVMYESPVTVVMTIVSVVSFMAVTGYIGRIIIRKLRAKIEEENLGKQAVIKKLTELDACSNIGMMTHRIVHDLRGPLSSISGYVEMELLSPGKTEEEKQALADMSEIVANMSASLKNLTAFGRVKELRKEKVCVREFMHSLVNILSYHENARDVWFRQNYDAARDFCVLAVRQDLQQAYFNILKNAVEALKGRRGPKIVEIAAVASQGMCEVSISNNGSTIPEEVLRKLFKQIVSGKSDGTGVGMIITHDLLAKNDVSIEIKNLDGGAGVVVRTRMPQFPA